MLHTYLIIFLTYEKFPHNYHPENGPLSSNFYKHLSDRSHMPGTVLGGEDTAVNKQEAPFLVKLS